MKIGVLLAAYNTEKYVDRCLSSWIELKKEYDITIGCTCGMFSGYISLGITPKNKPTLRKLIEHDLDFIISTGSKCLLDEDTSRNGVLNILKTSCDIIWILDADEFYTKNDILGIISFVEKNPEYDWYSVNFKNYTFTDKLFTDGFCPPRIFRTDRHEGIDSLYFDAHIKYKNGESFENKPNAQIPRNIAWVNHYSWLNGDSRSKEKIPYQNNRFTNGCAFKLNEENDELKFNEDFWNRINLELPILHEEIDFFSHDFTIDFSRTENTFYIKNILNDKNLTFKIYDGRDGNLIYETSMVVLSNYNYFIYPSSLNYHNIEDFKKFRIEVIENEKIIHNEFIHIK